MTESQEQIRQLNIKVAKAIGWKYHQEHDCFGFDESYLDTPDQEPKHLPISEWNPATNWNDAMFAAEKAELFDDQMNYLIKTRNGAWAIERIDRWGYAGNIDISNGETGPIAICNAILFFKDSK